MILKSRFINREAELEFLKKKYRSGKAELIIVYGRRRIGKTYLLQKFLSEVGGVYLLAEESETILEDFSERLASYFNDPVLKENPLRSWKGFFTYLYNKSSERLLVVIDEVQYIAKTHKEFLSILQKYWDLELSKTKIMLVLCGSLVSFMEGVLSAKSPIYGRRTGSWKVEEMDFFSVKDFHPIDVETAVRIYSVFGGVPQYWADYNPRMDFWDNIRTLLLSKGAKYYDEPKYLLKQELRDVTRYFSILRAIALGYTRFGQIAEKANMTTKSLSKYLNVLEDMGYIIEERPVIGKGKGVYRICDKLFNFWFRFVYPKRSEIEMGLDVVDDIKREFNQYVGLVFEEIAKQLLIRLNQRGKLPFKVTKLGRWWHKDKEIDVVCLNEMERKAMLVEVRWRDLGKRDVRRIVSGLKKKAEAIPLEDYDIFYCVVAKRIEDKEELSKEFLVYDLRDMSREH